MIAWDLTPNALKGGYDSTAAHRVEASFLRRLQDTTKAIPKEMLADQMGPTQLMIEVIRELTRGLGMESLVIASGMQEVLSSVLLWHREIADQECFALAALRAVRDETLASVRSWESGSIAKPRQLKLSKHLRRRLRLVASEREVPSDEGSGRAICGLREGRSGSSPENMTIEKHERKLEPGSSVCFRHVGTGRQCNEPCSRNKCKRNGFAQCRPRVQSPWRVSPATN